jgi:hypothetical protein
MKSLLKTAAVALAAAAGISNAAAGISNTAPLYPDPTTDAAKVPQISGGTGLSFEDLRVGPVGKVAVEIGSTKAPVRMADNQSSSCTR